MRDASFYTARNRHRREGPADTERPIPGGAVIPQVEAGLDGVGARRDVDSAHRNCQSRC